MNKQSVSWSTIEAECGDYRSGFVAIFRKYEGQATDEKDEAGRTVKVTIESFARHVGIPPSTFSRWTKTTKRVVQPEDRQRMDASMARTKARALPPAEKAKLAAELLEDEQVAEQVVADKRARHNVNKATDEHYRRDAIDRHERTERKAAADPVDRGIDALLWVNRLGEICERFARDGNEALRHVGALPEGERHWLTGSVDRAEATARAARRYLELGKSEFDADLEALLENGS